MSEIVLEVKNLYVQFTVDKLVTKAVNGVSFTIGKGESIGLVGETGAGKTTTAKAIMELIPSPPGEITSGEILFNGQNILKMTDSQLRSLRGKSISMIFQDPMTALNPVLTVGNQISEVIRLHQKISKAEAEIKTMELMEMVGIEGGRFAEYPHQFSGGMRQRIVIAMALACNSKLLIADEPTTALDVTIQAQVMDLIEKLKKNFKTSLLLITHDLGIVAEMCDKVAIIYAGEILEFGTLKQIFHNAKHPYTIGLFGSIPNFNQKVKRLKPINGLMPDPTNLPNGCKFQDRCEKVHDRCRSGVIDNVEIDSGHLVRCTLFRKDGE